MVDTISKVKGIQFDSNNLNAYTTSLRGLSDAQARVVLSSAGLDKAQQKQILTSLSATKSTMTLTSAEAMKALTEELGSKKEAKRLLIKSKLVTSDQIATGAKFELNKQMVLEAINLGRITQEEGEQIITAFGLSGGNIGLATSFKLLGKSIGQAFAALMTNPFTYLIAGLVSTIVVIKQTTKAIEGIRDKAQELGSSFNDSKSEIEGYKSQIQDLYKTINDSGSSIEEVTTARQTLMSVQDELIDKFGDEKETIDLVTQAINGQSAALDDLVDKQWQETKNKFNESGIWNDFGNWREGYSNNIDRMVGEMTNASVSLKMSLSDYNSGKYDEFIKRLEQMGWGYDTYFETWQRGSDDTFEGATGSAEDLYEEILKIQSLADDDMPNNFLDSLTNSANNLKNTLDDYEDIWDNYVLNDMILEDDNLENSWKEVNKAYSEYQEAVQSGDEAAIEATIAGFASSINTVLNDENVDDSVKDYFRDMYPALYREVEKWEFKTTIIPDFDISGLQGKTQADILKMLQTDGTQEGEDIFNSIVESAITYGLIIDDNAEGIKKVLDLLVEWGILQGTISENSPEVKETVISLSELEGASDKIKALSSAFKELSDDGYITTKTLGEIKTATGLLDDEWKSYETTLLNVKKGSSEFNQVMSDLTFKILDATFKKNDIVDATEDEIAAVLRESNVINAEAVARSYLANTMSTEEKARAEGIISRYNLNKLTEDNVVKLLEEASVTNLSRNEMIKLTASTIAFNNTELDTAGKIEQLKNLALYAGVASEATTSALNTNLAGRRLGNQGKSVVDYVYNELFGSTPSNIKFTAPIYSSSGSGSSSSKNEPDYKDPTDAIINRINLQSKQLEKDAEVIQDNIDLAESEKDYNKQLELTNSLLDTNKEHLEALRGANTDLSAEADKLRNANPKYDTTAWFDPYGEFTEEYYNFYNNLGTKEEQEKVEELAQSLQKLKQAWHDNADAIADVNKELLDNKENIEDIRSDIYDKQIGDIEHARDMLLNNDPDANVSSFYKQLQDTYHARAEYLRSVDPEKYAEEIQELQILWWDAQKELDDIALGKYEELREAEIKHLEVKYDKEQAIISALEKRYDVQRQIRDKQAEIDAELASSKALPEYLEDNSTLFNDKDYKNLSGELSHIDKSIVGLYDDYRREINNLAEDEWYKQEEITAQFERQLDVTMDKYELAEKELELTKKRLEYDNIIKQRDTRIMVAGGWINTTDPDKVREVQKAYAQAQSEKENLVLTQAEDAALRSMQSVSDSTNTLRLSIENISTMLDNLSEGELARFARTLDIGTLDEWLAEVGLQDYSVFDSNSSSSTRLAPKSTTYTSVIPDEWFNSESRAIRYTGIDKKGNLISEPIPDGYSEVFTKPQSALEKALLSGTGFAQRVLQTMPPPMSMMPNFTTPNIPNIQSNNTSSNIQHYTFTGDIVLTEAIEDGTSFIHSLVSEIDRTFDVTKNMK